MTDVAQSLSEFSVRRHVFNIESSFCKQWMSLTIRPIGKNDVEMCGKIGYEAHKTISSSHGYPSEQPSEEFGINLIKRLVGNPNSWGVLAERQGNVLGSIFLHKFLPSPVAVIGPLTVHPSAEGSGVGRALMNAALDQAQMQKQDQVRLVQSPSHIRSFVLYTKCGFMLREPLLLMQGKPSGRSGGSVSVAQEDHNHKLTARLVQDHADLVACNQLCNAVHGFSREMELRQAKDQGVAIMTENQNGIITGYAASIGLFGHAVAKSNEGLKILISSAPQVVGSGFFVPARNWELLNWLLENDSQIAWPANLMAYGAYQNPRMPFLPSLAY
jgi:GNAT superfamily N-acetyltransferase